LGIGTDEGQRSMVAASLLKPFEEEAKEAAKNNLADVIESEFIKKFDSDAANLRNTEQKFNWKDIPGYEGRYQASDFGYIKSLVGNEKILKPGTDKKGYRHVVLSKNGEKKTIKVHQLIMLTFIGEPEQNQEVMHLDSNPFNNALTNLKYGNHSANMAFIPKSTKTIMTKGIAKELNVSERSIDDAKVITNEGTPAEIKAVGVQAKWPRLPRSGMIGN